MGGSELDRDFGLVTLFELDCEELLCVIPVSKVKEYYEGLQGASANSSLGDNR
ncbi:MAG: hypothetical protein PWP39_1776 [Pyrococcus sp.]|nr:hypothetical protein [Pyrococcus sp.]